MNFFLQLIDEYSHIAVFLSNFVSDIHYINSCVLNLCQSAMIDFIRTKVNECLVAKSNLQSNR